MPPISSTFTPPNHPSALVYKAVILEYLESERALGRMSGPYSRADVESILGGHFRSSPLHVVPKATPPGSPQKYRLVINLSFEDPSGTSVNSLIDSDDFPTRWGGAREVENIVSLPRSSLLQVPFFLLTSSSLPSSSIPF